MIAADAAEEHSVTVALTGTETRLQIGSICIQEMTYIEASQTLRSYVKIRNLHLTHQQTIKIHALHVVEIRTRLRIEKA